MSRFCSKPIKVGVPWLRYVGRQTSLVPVGAGRTPRRAGEDLVLFFGPDGERQPEREIRERKAKQICMGCPVRTECLDYAVSRPEKYGTGAV